MTFYLKYRPQTFDELDLEEVRKSLKNIIKSGNLPHAFLFSGPKGTGKTSAARILAKALNCENLSKDGEPCNKCSSCISITKGNNIDIIELDAASNRGIDDIRSLKEGISLSPALAKKKVYIIDEAHMLTLEAANAFLKTLEEPPAHVVFILATTNPEKLPETVVSRLTSVNFTKATANEIARQLKRVAKGEKIKISDDAIVAISKKADGSFRDAVKILESLSLKTKDIDIALIEEILPTYAKNIDEFLKILQAKDARACLEYIENLVTSGISTKDFFEKILENVHRSFLAKNGLGEDELNEFSVEDLIRLSELLNDAKRQNSPISQLPLEIAVVKFCNMHSVALPQNEKKKQEEKKEKEEIKIENKKDLVALDEETWTKILQSVREKNVSIEALLRAAKPLNFEKQVLTLGVCYQFHKDHLEEGKNMKVLEEVCKLILEIDSLKIVYELVDKPAKEKKFDNVKNVVDKQSLSTSVDKDIIEAAKEIFG